MRTLIPRTPDVARRAVLPLALGLALFSGCYSPTAGFMPPCYQIPAHERNAKGKPRIICRVPSTAAERERAENRRDTQTAVEDALRKHDREEHDDD